jgi:hypothetical protein
MLPSKDMQVSAGLGVGRNLAGEDDVVDRNFTSVELNGGFSHFIENLHGQRARECKGDCNGKKEWSRSVHVKR